MVSTLSPERFDEIEEALKDVMDPELGINVVDLGLIYDLGWDDENDALIIHMTLTSAGCPLTDVLEEQTAEALDGVVDQFRINWVWMPPAEGIRRLTQCRPGSESGATLGRWCGGEGQMAKPRARIMSRPSSVIFSGPHGGSQTQLIL